MDEQLLRPPKLMMEKSVGREEAPPYSDDHYFAYRSLRRSETTTCSAGYSSYADGADGRTSTSPLQLDTVTDAAVLKQVSPPNLLNFKFFIV